jgi:hypothetical protein
MTESTTPLLVRLKKDEFWKKDSKSQRENLIGATSGLLSSSGCIVDDVDVFTKVLDSLMRELDLIKKVSVDDRLVPVDYHIADIDLQHQFNLNKLVEKIPFVAKEWNSTKETLCTFHPTSVLFNPVVWERPN